MKILDFLTMANLNFGSSTMTPEELKALQTFAYSAGNEVYLFAEGAVVTDIKPYRANREYPELAPAHLECNLYFVDMEGNMHLLAQHIREDQASADAPLRQCKKLAGYFIHNPEYHSSKGISMFKYDLKDGKLGDPAPEAEVK